MITKIVYYFSEKAKNERAVAAMNEFLSQATSITHLEKLEKEWFSTRGRI